MVISGKPYYVKGRISLLRRFKLLWALMSSTTSLMLKRLVLEMTLYQGVKCLPTIREEVERSQSQGCKMMEKNHPLDFTIVRRKVTLEGFVQRDKRRLTTLINV